MGDGNGTVVETDFVERGFYGQVLTGGVYVGWNDNGNGITDNARNIEYSAANYGIDPDLLRAVVYLENTQGWYDVLDPSPTGARPGNINPDLWAGLTIRALE